jgi:hypothetical protein
VRGGSPSSRRATARSWASRWRTSWSSAPTAQGDRFCVADGAAALDFDLAAGARVGDARFDF